MGNLGTLLAGIKRLAVNGVALAVGTPPSIVMNLLSPLSAALNATTGNYDVSVGGILPAIDVTAAPYNATGNGTTDDTASISAAIAAATADGGGQVFFPAGKH